MSQENSYEVGDIVKLKSGGPDMTVKIIYEKDNQYRCQWFAGKKLDDGIFPHESLIKVEEV